MACWNAVVTKIIGRAKGYYNARRKVFRVAKQAVKANGTPTSASQKKRNFRSWITRINAAARIGLSWPLNDMHAHHLDRVFRTSPCTVRQFCRWLKRRRARSSVMHHSRGACGRKGGGP